MKLYILISLTLLLSGTTLIYSKLVLSDKLASLEKRTPITVTVSQDEVFRSESELQSTRDRLIEYLYQTNILPDIVPKKVNENELLLEMPSGMSSTIIIHKPLGNSVGSMIFHQGHLSATPDAINAIETLVSKNITVYELDMPLKGNNPLEVLINSQYFGRLTINHHNDFYALEDSSENFVPLRYFIDPVISVVNYLENSGEEKIGMMGISGGGWTTVVASAIDERIEKSYSVAGSMPIRYHYLAPSTGDYEQIIFDFYQIADYPKLYMLGAFNRRQMLFYNSTDPCCFNLSPDSDFSALDTLEPINIEVEYYQSKNHVYVPVILDHIVKDYLAD